MTAPTPRSTCPSGQHHGHPGLTCQQHEQWRRDMDAAINREEEQ
ncbi:hypothetical protein [Streptomyces sp. SID685]|nr:hypothetical protein [Streptomyces sp. SID685]